MWYVTQVEPNSPAGRAGLRRGDQLVEIDGVDFLSTTSSAGLAALNAGLSPDSVGESHRFVLRRAGQDLSVTLQAASVAFTPVQNVRTFDTSTGKVGYMTFNSHNAVSELQLINAFTTLRNAGVSDLVMDMRYNGGGLLYLAAEVGYMIAGPANTAGKVFERTLYNDKMPPEDPIPFRSTAYGFQTANPARAGQALPTLNLKRVTILTTPGTCSASESVINGLRGADVEVNLIGGKTCGKPYGFLPMPNCGTTYFSVQLQGANHKGFGDYADGLAATCNVADDYAHSLGDQNEGMLAAALRYRSSGTCDAPVRALARPLELVRHPAEAAKIVPQR
jgi:C-terminal processing protease CtpA/Prc